MTANKMPVLPEAVVLGEGLVGDEFSPIYGYTKDHVQSYGNGRHDEGYADGYLAGLEDAKACVPANVTIAAIADEEFSWDEAAGFNTCSATTLANLTALEQEVKK